MHTPYGEVGEYGVMMHTCDGGWVFIPTGTKEHAIECLKEFFEKKHLDLTQTDVKSNFYCNMNQAD